MSIHSTGTYCCADTNEKGPSSRAFARRGTTYEPESIVNNNVPIYVRGLKKQTP
jgi:hypothetical protein